MYAGGAFQGENEVLRAVVKNFIHCSTRTDTISAKRFIT